MRILRFVVAALTLTALAASEIHAEEPYLEFLQGLRQRGYHDTALLYLDTLRDDPNCPRETKELVPFEKAATLLTMARSTSITNPDVQKRQLEEALGYLKEFTDASPNHPRAGEANSEKAGILLGQVRVEVWQSRSPGNYENRAEFQQRARDLVKQARAIYQTAHDQHKAKWEGYKKFIDQTDDRQLYEERRQAEVKYIVAQLDLSNCTYEEAQSYDRDSDEYAAKLRDAAAQYEDIHTKYRSQLGGLYARLWQGKCYEEQNDIQRAIGIYNELLEHPGQSPAMIQLQDQVRHFKLICLNHEKRKDYQLVIDQATEWVAGARGSKKYTNIGIGIQWEQALAYEALADQRDTSEADQRRLINSALANVRTIKRFPGQYKDLATFKERDLMLKLRGEDSLNDPQDFETAFSLAQDMVTKKTKPLQDAIANAKSGEDRQKAQQDLQIHIDEASRLLQIALRLSDADTAVSDVNRARYYLGYMHLLARRNYEAAILTGFVARNYGDENPVQAQDAAYMSMAAFLQAFNENGKARRRADQEIDVAQMREMAEFLIENWPASDRAMDARDQLGRVYRLLEDFPQAAYWFSQIPPAAARYTEAQTLAGQAYWSAYVLGANKADGERPTQEQLDEWMTAAEQHLRTGIERGEKATPAATPASDELIAAKVSLVQILVSQQKYQDGVNLLMKDPHAVINAIQVEDETKRPEDTASVKSISFASLSYQLLLRCYVGLGNEHLDDARATMNRLEKVGGGGGAALTEVYRQLGDELKQELAQLKAAGKVEQFDQVRSSFETFLADLFKRKDQTVNSLTWIGETNYGLAQGSADDPASASKYFDSAASAYQSILDRAAADEKFIDPARLDSVRLRLVNCRRNQGNFEQAEELVKAIISAKPRTLDAQVEAAYVYQNWGTSGQGDTFRKLVIAMAGDKDSKIWGWGQTAVQLQRTIEMGGPDAASRWEDRLYESQFNLATCQHEYGKAQTGPERKSQFERAKSTINTFVAITQNFDDDWWAKFDVLFQEIQRSEGTLTPVALERPESFEPVPPEQIAARKAAAKKTKKKSKKAAVAKADEDSGAGLTYAMFGVVALLGVGGGAFMVMKGSKGRRPSAALAATQVEAPVIAPPPVEAPRKKRPASAGKAAPAKQAAAKAPAAAGEKPKRPLTPEEKEKLRRRRAAQAKAKAEQEQKKQDGAGSE
ncbi:MAG: tetratricopeptide repeat protein [Planctomycetota bacterium]|jgi:hypothetical protein